METILLKGEKGMTKKVQSNLSNPKAGGCLAAIILLPLQIIYSIITIPIMLIVAIIAGIAKLFGAGDKK